MLRELRPDTCHNIRFASKEENVKTGKIYYFNYLGRCTSTTVRYLLLTVIFGYSMSKLKTPPITKHAPFSVLNLGSVYFLTWPTYPRAVAVISFSLLSLPNPASFFPGSVNAMPAILNDEPLGSLSVSAQKNTHFRHDSLINRNCTS